VNTGTESCDICLYFLHGEYLYSCFLFLSAHKTLRINKNNRIEIVHMTRGDGYKKAGTASHDNGLIVAVNLVCLWLVVSYWLSVPIPVARNQTTDPCQQMFIVLSVGDRWTECPRDPHRTEKCSQSHCFSHIVSQPREILTCPQGGEGGAFYLDPSCENNRKG